MASISEINGKFRVQIRRKGFKSISAWFPTEAKAKAWARDTEGKMLAGQPVKTKADGKTIAQLIEAYRRMRASTRPISDASTEHYTLKQLKRSLGDIVAAALTAEDLVAWAQQRRDEGAGPYTVNCDLSKLGTVLRYTSERPSDAIAAARPRLSYLGLIGGGGQRERRPTEDESQAILGWLEENKGRRYSDATLFAALTAMRRGEVCRILWEDLDRAKKLVLIRDRKDPRQKEGNDQWVPLLGEAWSIAIRQPKDDARIFPIHPQTISKYFREGCVALGIPDLHLHDLRHEGISKMFEMGFDIPQVAVVSGHRDWRHLKRYTQIKPESLHDHSPHRDTPPRRGNQPSAASRRRKSSP